MKKRNFAEMISYFNQTVADMDIDRKYKMEILGMITAIAFEHEHGERKMGKWTPVDSYSAYGGDEATWEAHGNPIAFHYCSCCKNQAFALEDGTELLSKHCPDCGAAMTEGEQE